MVTSMQAVWLSFHLSSTGLMADEHWTRGASAERNREMELICREMQKCEAHPEREKEIKSRSIVLVLVGHKHET